jgi:glycyl-tRNA synthetase beta chain
LGVLRILLEAQLDLDLTEVLGAAAAAQPVQRAGTAHEVYDFIAERLRGILLEQPGTTSEMLDAVLANRPRSPLDAVMRLAALREFLLLPDAAVLAAINKRISNILKKAQVSNDWAIDPQALTEDAERGLHHALTALREPVLEATEHRRYAASLQALVELRAPVNEFFDRVMVMDEDSAKRNNRLALLRDAQILLSGVADLSRLPG